MGFIDKLSQVEPIEYNKTLINGSDIVQSSVQNANDSTGGLWFVMVIMVLFFYLIFVFMKQDENFKYDYSRALLISSGWCLMISVVAGLIGFSVTIYPIVWFSTIFFLSGIGVMNRKQKRL